MAGNKLTYKSLDDLITFGLHRGRTLEDVIKNDRAYVIWMHKNTGNKLGKRLVKEIIEKYPQYSSDFEFILNK